MLHLKGTKDPDIQDACFLHLRTEIRACDFHFVLCFDTLDHINRHSKIKLPLREVDGNIKSNLACGGWLSFFVMFRTKLLYTDYWINY